MNKGTIGIYPSELFANRSRNYLFGYVEADKTDKEAYEKYLNFTKIITSMLKEFGIHRTNNGYGYIIDAVMVIIDLHTLDIRLNNDVYPLLARKYDYLRYTSIEHNIRNAIKSACTDYERNPGCNKMDIFGGRPTNKQFLFYIAENTWQKMQRMQKQ